ncbi:hypothetical protein PRIPAC_73365 [Pristionchus pacificus]|uniref:Uncharacterized protein n=1 Tax=Pristionchus pacificus TaxID=54126 RepID=A0A2A6BF41_PRIPA|nr:hypothetical protein PRIPAC_73365 [Pristionchus pacificus]|eukprot:PDM64525.1 hypothetical protein PRIPAC_52781 [Pristionchus pacificus]
MPSEVVVVGVGCGSMGSNQLDVAGVELGSLLEGSIRINHQIVQRLVAADDCQTEEMDSSLRSTKESQNVTMGAGSTTACRFLRAYAACFEPSISNSMAANILV